MYKWTLYLKKKHTQEVQEPKFFLIKKKKTNESDDEKRNKWASKKQKLERNKWDKIRKRQKRKEGKMFKMSVTVVGVYALKSNLLA